MDTRFAQGPEEEHTGPSMPMQAPPVNRSSAGAPSTTSAITGVEPAGLLDLARFLDIDVGWGPIHGGLHI